MNESKPPEFGAVTPAYAFTYTSPCPRCAGLAEEIAELRREVDRLADLVREIERGEE